MTGVSFQRVIENPLYEDSGWEDHNHLVTGIYTKYQFNSNIVKNMIVIGVCDSRDAQVAREDGLEEAYLHSQIETDVSGAKLLISALQKMISKIENT